MKKTFQVTLITLLLPLLAVAQGKPNYVGQWYKRNSDGKQANTFEIYTRASTDAQQTKKYKLKVNVNQLNSVLRTAPDLVDITIPYGNNSFTLNLAKVEVLSPEFRVRTNLGNVPYSKSVSYRGIVNGNPAFVASLSLNANEITGLFSTDAGNFVITKEGIEYIVYNDKDFPAPDGLVLCSTQDPVGYQIPSPGGLVSGIGCKTVNVYFECDYAFFQNKGSSTANVANYVIAFFNEVATLYANENIAIQISQIYVWTQPDPYASMTTTSSVLTAFKTNRGTSFNGDLAHFLTTRNLGGGVAYVNVLCNKSYAYGVSQVYSTFNTAPTYSWTVEVVTHELGHNLGSPHTHSCSWTSGALDNCYTPEGTCLSGPAPTSGGTIMSYCHLTSTGINFNNGFGSEPGNLIRSKVLGATCLSTGGATAPTGLTASSITANSVILNWLPTSGAANYTVEYMPSSSTTWTSLGTTSGTTMSVTRLLANTAYLWHVRSDCSNFAEASTFSTTGTETSTCLSPGSLVAANIGTNTVSLSWAPVSGATSYTVQYGSPGLTPTTLSTTSTTATLSGLTAGTGYSWQVRANCSPYSSPSSFTTSVAPQGNLCLVATGLNATNITSSSAQLSWIGSTTASAYTVTVRKAGTTRTNTFTTSSSTLPVSGLQKRTRYEWLVNTRCNDNSSSGNTSPAYFTTP